MAPLNRYSPQDLMQLGAYDTAREIMQQPQLWQEVASRTLAEQEAIVKFLTPLLAAPNLRIVLTGAGSSAFVGQSVAPFLKQTLGIHAEAIATTDLVSHPNQGFSSPPTTPDTKSAPLLLVSFARSGNSPESVAAVNLADQLTSDQIHHLIITCNPEGKLAQTTSKGAKRVLALLMPEAANDQGFAMTGSLTSMYLCALMAFELAYEALSQDRPTPFKRTITSEAVFQVAMATSKLIENGYTTIQDLARDSFERCIWLGSAGFKALAEEASLKLLELTAGQVMSAYNSPLGFRHGPKSAVNQKTITFFCLSQDPYAKQYDLDLLHEMQQDGVSKKLVVLSTDSHLATSTGQDSPTTHLVLDTQVCDALNYLPYLVVGQIFAFEKSLHLGISPDNPCPSGMVNRVVQGVTIHPFTT